MDRQSRPGIIQEQGDYGIFVPLSKKDRESYEHQEEVNAIDKKKKDLYYGHTGKRPTQSH